MKKPYPFEDILFYDVGWPKLSKVALGLLVCAGLVLVFTAAMTN
jgi:hypothetical protein